MKINLLFVLIDIVVLLAYPVVYIVNQVRRLWGTRQ